MLILLIIFSSLLAEEPSFQEKIEIAEEEWSDNHWEVYISPIVVGDVGIGYAKRNALKKSYQEGTVFLHADFIPSVWELRNDAKDFYKIYVWGIKCKSAYYYRPDYSGFNWFFNVGFQSFLADLSLLDPGGSSGSLNPTWNIFPNLALGCGYCWKLQNDHYFRISLDAGLKLIFSNLYFSYGW